MDMSNLRVESHVAQKNRRHKLRFQQNFGDLNHHQHQQDHPHFEHKVDIHRAAYSYNPHFLPPEMFPSHGFVSHDDHHQDSLQYPQDCNYWKTVVSSQQEVTGDHWNPVSYNSNAVSIDSGYGYHQDTQNYSSSPFYHNALQQDHVTLALPPQSKNESAMNPSIPCWMNSCDESMVLANRVNDHREQTTMAVKEGNCNTQGLSLSLSSVPQLKDDQLILQSGQNFRKSELLLNSDPKSLMGVSGFAHRNSGQLGPFTGYATILKNSKYIKPAQELLNGSCEVGYQELGQRCHDAYSHKIIEEEMSWASDCPVSGRNSSGTESHRPEFHRKKARLMYMQQEVCRRYKQYLQQMQMVISSFETVAGLSAATPYVCLALKVVSRHFHHVKNVISDQLSQMRKTVGEGLCSPTTTISKTFDANATTSSGVKFDGGGGAGFFVPQQPVWRPQRGLPERAIAVLKTWLFDHFLHPYPSDADKHMLATQTGLTRNQVSNWFINARVRIWKPMVEEIHVLETKGLQAVTNSSHPQSDGQDPGWMDMSSLSNTQPPECSRNPGVNVNLTVNEPRDQLNDHEKQSKPEYQNIPLSGMDRLMSIMPYPRATFDATGLGPVSLTLGLRQNAEHVQQLQQHFGGQLIHDFVG